MPAALGDLACDLKMRWKLWLEDRDAARAGGAYVFDSRDAAIRYLEKHRDRLVFCETDDQHTAWVLIDWRDRASFERFVADPQVKATMRSGGAMGAPEFVALQRCGQYDG